MICNEKRNDTKLYITRRHDITLIVFFYDHILYCIPSIVYQVNKYVSFFLENLLIPDFRRCTIVLGQGL